MKAKNIDQVFHVYFGEMPKSEEYVTNDRDSLSYLYIIS